MGVLAPESNTDWLVKVVEKIRELFVENKTYLLRCGYDWLYEDNPPDNKEIQALLKLYGKKIIDCDDGPEDPIAISECYANEEKEIYYESVFRNVTITGVNNRLYEALCKKLLLNPYSYNYKIKIKIDLPDKYDKKERPFLIIKTAYGEYSIKDIDNNEPGRLMIYCLTDALGKTVNKKTLGSKKGLKTLSEKADLKTVFRYNDKLFARKTGFLRNNFIVNRDEVKFFTEAELPEEDFFSFISYLDKKGSKQAGLW